MTQYCKIDQKEVVRDRSHGCPHYQPKEDAPDWCKPPTIEPDCAPVPRASKENSEKGWTLDPSFIQLVSKEIEERAYPPTEENIEEVLLALVNLKKLKVEG